ncbi:IDLSRF-like peptide isoform X2 [Topomyia yanbarensis]|uniref:IDLSRF-like peptide isoform X2 n=1 Tax=Topomyia yanbarensis TaxID=2498891 RepID=UPI00273C8122|nr:IDLSRF-like peptide isoform X2 [Topomyia yanbarensis]
MSRVYWIAACNILFVALPFAVFAIDLSRLYGHLSSVSKRSEACHPYEPFRCPGDGNCISIQYLCDGAPDCSDGYDEDMRLCTAAKRPPVEETASFLQSLLASHGPNYLEKLFGSKARDALAPLGGVEKVAITLSESQTIEDFGAALHLMSFSIASFSNFSITMFATTGDKGDPIGTPNVWS